jgi:16S rRNA (adenine1518-N6/adenine1519-N6)-dimethyltransferase
MHRKKKSLGQNFLHDQNVIRKIIALVAPKESEHLIEIGPGSGALTTRLLPQVSALDVIELDQDVIPSLEKNCNYSPKLHIHIADVLEFDFQQFRSPLRIVGNLPYNISTPLLFYLLKNVAVIQDMHFMLQKEVAERIVAVPGTKTYGRLSVMLQYYCETKLLLHIGSGAFTPSPKVESAFIRFIPRNSRVVAASDESNFGNVVRLAFNQRRKTILNSLKKQVTALQLENIGVNPKLRPEQLAVDDFVRISNQASFA